MKNHEYTGNPDAATIARAARDQRDRQEVMKLLQTRAANRGRITPDMVVYDHNSYSIKIVEELLGFITCVIIVRETNSILHTVRFQKNPNNGVVYEIRDPVRMNFLAFSEKTLSSIEILTSKVSTA